MLMFAYVLQGAAAIFGALTVMVTVSVAAPGGLIVLRQCAHTLDYSSCGYTLMLRASRNVDRYQRAFKRSLNTLFMAHGLPLAPRRHGLEPPPDPGFLWLVKSGCGYSGGLCPLDYDLGFDATHASSFDGFVRPTMAPTRPSKSFLLADDATLPLVYDYAWAKPTSTPVLGTTHVGELPATFIKYDVPFNVASPVSSYVLPPTATTAYIDMVDFVPLMAAGLFLSILITGMLLVPSVHPSTFPTLSWRYISHESSSGEDEFWRKYDDLEAGLAHTCSTYSSVSVCVLNSSTHPSEKPLPTTAPTSDRRITERHTEAETAVIDGISVSTGRGSIPAQPLGDPPG